VLITTGGIPLDCREILLLKRVAAFRGRETFSAPGQMPYPQSLAQPELFLSALRRLNTNSEILWSQLNCASSTTKRNNSPTFTTPCRVRNRAAPFQAELCAGVEVRAQRHHLFACAGVITFAM